MEKAASFLILGVLAAHVSSTRSRDVVLSLI